MGSLSVMKKLSIEELETLIDISEKKIKTYTEMIDEARKELKRRKTKYRCLFIFSDKMAKYYLVDWKKDRHIFIDPEYRPLNEFGVGSVRFNKLKKERDDNSSNLLDIGFRTLYFKEIIDDIYIYR